MGVNSEQGPGQREPSADMQLQSESRALWLGLTCTLLGIVVGLIAFSSYRPGLAGTGSVAIYASVVAALAATAGSVLGYLTVLVRTQDWLLALSRYRQFLNAFALMIIHAAISAMAALITFRIFQDAFRGLTVDRYAASLMVGVCAGIAGYVALVSAARVTAQSLAALLAIFMATGVFISMLAAENPYWWHSMFSSLGTRDSGLTSFWTFNVTLVVSGLVLSTLTAFIVRNVALLAVMNDRFADVLGKPRARFIRPRPGVVRACLLGLGICVVSIGLVPVNVAPTMHAFIVRFAAGIIVVLLLGATLWLPGFPWVFHLLSFFCFLGLVGAALLWQPLEYYNLTAFELAVVGIVFGWLIVFIRTTAAALAVKTEELSDVLAAHQ